MYGLYYKNLLDVWVLHSTSTNKRKLDKLAKKVAKAVALNGRVTVQTVG